MCSSLFFKKKKVIIILEVLEFIFQDFIHWFGTFLLVSAIAEGIGGIFRGKGE